MKTVPAAMEVGKSRLTKEGAPSMKPTSCPAWEIQSEGLTQPLA